MRQYSLWAPRHSREKVTPISSVEQTVVPGERFNPDRGTPRRTDQASVRPATVWLLIALQLLLGVGAVFGGGVLILAPDGSLLGMPMELLAKSPFTNFLLPGLLLFFSVGVFPIAVAYSNLVWLFVGGIVAFWVGVNQTPWLRQHSVAAYFVLAYARSWAIEIPLAARWPSLLCRSPSSRFLEAGKHSCLPLGA